MTRCERVHASRYDVVASTTAGTSRTVSDPHSCALRMDVSMPRTLRLTTSGSLLESGEPPVLLVHDRVHAKTRLLRRLADLGRFFIPGNGPHLDGLEAGVARDGEPLRVRALLGQHRDERRFADGRVAAAGACARPMSCRMTASGLRATAGSRAATANSLRNVRRLLMLPMGRPPNSLDRGGCVAILQPLSTSACHRLGHVHREHETLAVGTADVAELRRSSDRRRQLEQSLRRAGLNPGCRSSHPRPSPSGAAAATGRTAPCRPCATRCRRCRRRSRPATAPALAPAAPSDGIEGADVDLKATRPVRVERQKAAVGREPAAAPEELVASELDRLALPVAGQRQDEHRVARPEAEEAAIGRPVRQDDGRAGRVLVQQLFGALASRRAPVHAVGVVANRHVGDLPSIRATRPAPYPAPHPT